MDMRLQSGGLYHNRWFVHAKRKHNAERTQMRKKNHVNVGLISLKATAPIAQMTIDEHSPAIRKIKIFR